MSRGRTGPLARFCAPVRDWFTGNFPAPTPAQEQAWAAIADGHNTLVVAPTGSGKTLAAFLWALDELIDPAPDEPGSRAGPRVLYISPLKALAVDVERNLRAPLAGIARGTALAGRIPPQITVGVRSGDTPPAARRRLVTDPPDILITTPESLFLMLTSAARWTLTSVRTVIVDEVHAVAGTKRGSHLALSLERVDAALDRPAQRIGLSATVKPAEEVARFLSGTAPVTVVSPGTQSLRGSLALSVLGVTEPGEGGVWPEVETRIVDLVETHRSSIVFVNSRRLAERLTARLNDIHAERAADGDGLTGPVAPLARAHHGSVARTTRTEIEEQLKSGRLRAVVATSSLELGIDMGAVDLVIQVEAPPSVAAGLQRIGRAGHGVGEVSTGVLIPKHRTDLPRCAVTVARMTAGEIETLHVPANPLDILAQHTVAAAAVASPERPLDVEAWFDTVRRAAPFAALARPVFEATLDLLSGKYPSTEFAELRPRLVYDRDAHTLTARPGAQRLAVTSGGAIPDRGLFAVYLDAGSGDGKPSRVGELDEEMVYESRPGDVISLGASSWRITDITHDRVLVVPAPGEPGRLPFWHGDGAGRPAELGAALGALVGELAALDRSGFDLRCAGWGFDQLATDGLWRLIDEQRAATTALPTDTTLVVERFRDELGDWRVVLHSPFGHPVHAPLALAVGARLRQRYGIDEKPSASDDGIVVRLPDTDLDSGGAPPGAELFVFDADEIDAIVTEEVGGSALFAARFRECAARALLLPRRNPGKRTPLWQQRQRAAQLLDVARRHPRFPIVLETVRECLHDVYDVPALATLLGRIASRRVRVVEVATAAPSPLAASLLFGYVGEFIYDGDTPLAERRAAALAIDTDLLAQLLGRVEYTELLDDTVIANTHRALQHLTPDRAARDAEAVADLLRLLGPLTAQEVTERSDADSAATGRWLDGLAESRRALRVPFARQRWWVAVEDIGLLRDGVGVAVPAGVPANFTEPVADPLGELLGRFARTRGPFTTAQAASRFGLGPSVAAAVLDRMAVDGYLVRGRFIESLDGAQWCDPAVLRTLRRRSLAALRAQIEPVSMRAYARFLPDWQQVDGKVRGVDGLAEVLEQLTGAALPASAVESLALPARVADYAPAMLDELLASGEVLWCGAGAGAGSDGWVAFHPAATAALTLGEPGELTLGERHRTLLDTLAGGGAFFFRQLVAADDVDADEAELKAALWDLVWAGRVTGDTFAPIRAVLAGAGQAVKARRPAYRQHRPPRLSRYSLAHPAARPADPAVAGRWALLPQPEPDSTLRAHHRAEVLLHRHGVLTRGAVGAESVPGGFAAVYKVLGAFTEAGRCQRGYFIESLGAAQFATAATVDRLRDYLDDPDVRTDRNGSGYQALVLAAADPANPYGAALPWPPREGARPSRRAGALVVLVGGELAWFVERGGRSVLTFTTDPLGHAAAAAALARLVTTDRIDGLTVERIDGTAVLDASLQTGEAVTPVSAALAEAGFSRVPRGLRLR